MTDKEDEDSIEGSDSSNGNIAEYVVPKKISTTFVQKLHELNKCKHV